MDSEGAMDCLVGTLDVRAMQPLIAARGGDQAPAVRRSALAALGRARELADEEPLLVGVREAIERTTDAFDVGVRASAARALAQLRDPAGAAALRRLVDRDLDGRV